MVKNTKLYTELTKDEIEKALKHMDEQPHLDPEDEEMAEYEAWCHQQDTEEQVIETPEGPQNIELPVDEEHLEDDRPLDDKEIEEPELEEDYNLIDDYINLMKNYTDAPDIFIEAAGYAISSMFLGQKIDSKFIKAGRPNVFICLSSIPGLMHRSTVEGSVDEIYKYIMSKEYDIEVLMDMQRQKVKKFDQMTNEKQAQLVKETSNDITEYSIIKTGTVEGIMDRMKQLIKEYSFTIKDDEDKIKYQKDFNFFLISDEEWGDAMKKIFDQGGYEKGVGTLYSRIYYCKGHTQFLSQRQGKPSRTIPDNLYVVMFCGMQDFVQYISEDAVKQGLMRRVLIVYVPKRETDEKGEIIDYKPYYNIDAADYTEHLKNFAEEIYRRYNEFKNEPDKKIYVEVEPEVLLVMNKLDKDTSNIINNDQSLANLSAQSAVEQIYKLAVCYQIAWNTTLRDYNGTITLTMDSWNKAKNFYDRAMTNVYKKFDEIGEIQEQPKSIRQSVDRVYKMIEKAQNGISRTEIYRKTSWDPKDTNRFIATLLATNQIHKLEVGTGGRPKEVFMAGQMPEPIPVVPAKIVKIKSCNSCLFNNHCEEQKQPGLTCEGYSPQD